MPATYTFDVVSTLDGFASFEGGDWGPFWGKGGPELLEHRLAAYREEQRLVLGANTYRQFVQLLGPSTETSKLDPLNATNRTGRTTRSRSRCRRSPPTGRSPARRPRAATPAPRSPHRPRRQRSRPSESVVERIRIGSVSERPELPTTHRRFERSAYRSDQRFLTDPPRT
jgi:hypothetical protein